MVHALQPATTATCGFGSQTVDAIGASDGTVHLWPVGDSSLAASLAVHSGPVVYLVPAAGGSRLFTADTSDCVRLVAPRNQTGGFTPLPERPTRGLCHTADPGGRWEASVSRHVVHVWDPASGEQLYQASVPPALLDQLKSVTSVGVDLAQKVVHVGGEAAVGRWNLETNEVRHVALDLSGFPHVAARGRMPPLKARISPDGKHAIAWEDKQLAVFDPATGRQRFLLSQKVLLGGVHFFLPGDRVAVTYRDSPQHGICVFDLTTGQEVDRHIHGFVQRDVACVAKSGLLLTIGKRGHSTVKEPSTLAIWKPGSPAQFLDLPDDAGGAWVGATRDGERALTAGANGVLLLWDLAQKRVLRRFALGIPLDAFDFDGRIAVATELNRKVQHIFEYVRTP